MIPVVIGIGLILLLAAGTAIASPRSSRGAQSRPAERGPDATTASLPSSILAAHQATFARYGAPMPPAAMAVIISRESAGRPTAIAYAKVTGGSELGMCQLVVEHDDAGDPKTDSRSGAIGANVDPLDPVGAIYGAQTVYERAKRQFSDDLQSRGMIVPPDSAVDDWIAIMQTHHSIGPGGFRILAQRIKDSGESNFINGLRAWFDSPRTFPTIGRQSAELVRTRAGKLLRLPADAAAVAPLPASIGPLPARGSDVPPFNPSRAKAAIVAAKARGR